MPRISVRGEGPDFTTFRVYIDGEELLSCLRLSLDVDGPQNRARRLVIVTDEFDVELNDFRMDAGTFVAPLRGDAS